MLDLYGQGYHAVGFTIGGESGDAFLKYNLWLDDCKHTNLDTSFGVSNTARDIRRWQAGWYSGAVGRHKIAAIALWNRELTTAEYRAAYAELVAATAATVTITPPTRIVMVDGDSLSSEQGVNSGYPRLYKLNQETPSWVFSRSRSGSSLTSGSPTTFTHLSARAAEMDTAFPTNRSLTKILTILIGANDLTSYPNAAAWVAVLQSYVEARRAAGWKVAVSTVLPKNSPAANYAAHNTYRATANATIRGWPAAGICDAVIDYAADPVMGVDTAPLDGAIWHTDDGLHPNAQGQINLEVIYRAVVDNM
jgi:lysophospholipase L1-like esterase